MSNKVEYVRPALHVDNYHKIADYLIQSDDYSLVQIGRVMKQMYKEKMVEIEEKKDVG